MGERRGTGIVGKPKKRGGFLALNRILFLTKKSGLEARVFQRGGIFQKARETFRVQRALSDASEAVFFERRLWRALVATNKTAQLAANASKAVKP